MVTGDFPNVQSNCVAGSRAQTGGNWRVLSAPMQSDRIRVVVLEVNGNAARNRTPSRYELEVFEAQPPAKSAP